MERILKTKTSMKGDKMKKLLALAALLPLIIIGCGQENKTDEEVLEDIVDTSDWFSFTGYQGNDSTVADTDKGKGTLIAPPLWWREISKRTKEIEVTVEGDSAYVELTLGSTGKFNVIGQITDSTGDTVLWGKGKSLKETAMMKGIFLRTGDENDADTKGWELKKLSGVKGYSTETHTVQIDSVRIQSVSFTDTLLTNPYETFFNKDNVMEFSALESVTVTLYTNTSDGEAFLHVFQNVFPWHFRIPMINNGNGSYTSEKWHVNLIPGVRFAVFDLLHHNTLYDTDYAYDYDGWLYPYIVK